MVSEFAQTILVPMSDLAKSLEEMQQEGDMVMQGVIAFATGMALGQFQATSRFH